MKNDELEENPPIETTEERMKILRTNEIYARIEAQTPGIKGVGGREKQRQLGRGNRRIT